MKTVITASTRLSAKSEPVQTVVTIDWTGATEDQIRAAAARTYVIDRQRKWRDAESIPTTDEIIARDHGKRMPATVDLKALLKQALANGSITMDDLTEGNE